MDDADIYNVCRLCMCGDNVLNDIMNESEELEFVIVDTVKDLLQLDIVKEEGRPWNVCSSCIKQLSDFLIFKRRCQLSKIEFENRQQPIDHSYSMIWNGQNQDQVGREAETTEAVDEDEDGPLEDVTSTSMEVEDCTELTNVDTANEATGAERFADNADEKIKSGNFGDAGSKNNCGEQDKDAAATVPKNGVDHSSMKPQIVKILSKDIVDAERKSEMKIFCCEKNVEDVKGWSVYRIPCCSPKKELYRCWHCPKGFGDRRGLGKHVIQHFQSKLYQWEIKSDSLQNRTSSDVVITNDSQGQTGKRTSFRCSYCKKAYDKRCELTRHVLTHFSKTLHQWNIEDDPSKREECGSLMKTLGGRMLRKFYRCLHCQKTYDRKDELGKHVLTHFQTSVHSWEIKSDLACREEAEVTEEVINEDRSEQSHQFEEIVDSVTNETIPDDCNIVIDEDSGSSKALNELTLKKQDRYECPLCCTTYSTKHSLMLHQKNKCNTIKYTCDICERNYMSKGAVNQHKKTVHSNILYQCSVCSNTYNDKSYLRRHLMIHSGIRPHRCPTCDKAFYSSSHLKAHMLTHTSERPYQCHICGKTFTRKKAFDEHNNEHLGIEPYHCSLCDMSFTRSKNLRRHIKVHSSTNY